MFNNISFIGMAGCGKSTIGKALSSKLSLSFVDTDLLIEARFNQSLESIKKSNGYEFVRMAEEEAILGIRGESFHVLSMGIVLIDSPLTHNCSFDRLHLHFQFCTPFTS